jgi:hypothetical protein
MSRDIETGDSILNCFGCFEKSNSTFSGLSQSSTKFRGINKIIRKIISDTFLRLSAKTCWCRASHFHLSPAPLLGNSESSLLLDFKTVVDCSRWFAFFAPALASSLTADDLTSVTPCALPLASIARKRRSNGALKPPFQKYKSCATTGDNRTSNPLD